MRKAELSVRVVETQYLTDYGMVFWRVRTDMTITKFLAQKNIFIRQKIDQRNSISWLVRTRR